MIRDETIRGEKRDWWVRVSLTRELKLKFKKDDKRWKKGDWTLKA
jgi:hypothetical protein